jgi:hypothetical protein
LQSDLLKILITNSKHVKPELSKIYMQSFTKKYTLSSLTSWVWFLAQHLLGRLLKFFNLTLLKYRRYQFVSIDLLLWFKEKIYEKFLRRQLLMTMESLLLIFLYLLTHGLQSLKFEMTNKSVLEIIWKNDF